MLVRLDGDVYILLCIRCRKFISDELATCFYVRVYLFNFFCERRERIKTTLYFKHGHKTINLLTIKETFFGKSFELFWVLIFVTS